MTFTTLPRSSRSPVRSLRPRESRVKKLHFTILPIARPVRRRVALYLPLKTRYTRPRPVTPRHRGAGRRARGGVCVPHRVPHTPTSDDPYPTSPKHPIRPHAHPIEKITPPRRPRIRELGLGDRSIVRRGGFFTPRAAAAGGATARRSSAERVRGGTDARAGGKTSSDAPPSWIRQCSRGSTTRTRQR